MKFLELNWATARWLIVIGFVAAGLWWFTHMHEYIGYALLRISMGGMVGWLFDRLLFMRHGELDDCSEGIEKAAILLRRGIVVTGFALASAMVV